MVSTTTVTQVPFCNPFQFLPLLSSLYKGSLAARLFTLNCSMCIPLNKMGTVPVLVCLGCCNTVQTWELTINRGLFLTVLESRNLSAGHQHGWVRALFQVAESLLYLDVVEGEQALWELFYKALIPFLRALPPDLITPKGPTS